jgi:hypothetical protein
MISTTKLGEKEGWTSKETFSKLSEWGLIEKVEDEWRPTERGLASGGQMVEHPKYGPTLRWKPSTSLQALERIANDGLLTATKIGEHFKVSGQKVNKILAEAGSSKTCKAGLSPLWERLKVDKTSRRQTAKSTQSGMSTFSRIRVCWGGSNPQRLLMMNMAMQSMNPMWMVDWPRQGNNSTSDIRPKS